MVSPDYSDWGASAKARPNRRAPSRGQFLIGDCVAGIGCRDRPVSAAETGRFWCGRRDLNPQAFWALAPKASVFAISPLPHCRLAICIVP
jgi:hypothetical protein